jgi:hypothetical protein
MADRSPEKRDTLLGTGDAIWNEPIPENASEHYLKARALAEKAISEGRLSRLGTEAPVATPRPR